MCAHEAVLHLNYQTPGLILFLQAVFVCLLFSFARVNILVSSFQGRSLTFVALVEYKGVFYVKDRWVRKDKLPKRKDETVDKVNGD
jgi:hypothetical protein